MVVFIAAQLSEIIMATCVTHIHSSSIITSHNGLIVCRYKGVLL